MKGNSFNYFEPGERDAAAAASVAALLACFALAANFGREKSPKSESVEKIYWNSSNPNVNNEGAELAKICVKCYNRFNLLDNKSHFQWNSIISWLQNQFSKYVQWEAGCP